MTIGTEYLKIVRERFRKVKGLGDKALQQLSGGDIHWTLNETSNSVAVIVKHLSGNMTSRWTDFLTSDGEKSDRNRDQEFINTVSSKQDMMSIWEKGWTTVLETLDALDEADLLKTVTVRGESHTVIDAIERQLAHYAYHVGQIVFAGKQLKDEAWETLSIPKGKSEEYLQQILKRHQD
ncbi:DUF1572 family protein [Lentibacillus salicampi]|uniref:DUF1572 domain-containing protein n=1 Tax=Lentibacillus salicampi TaxID=175306 RepID=A0A4Y9AAE2_9BACI|nr:DUF1572 family protein [Lentibacillus salicampi]TFJ91311.1 DUF1572 domain-containing protein [Lentibacillus salicampi]